MQTPVVSVILPAYNAERYIDSAVQSICAQTFTDFEFVIVNDGSRDNTETLLRAWAERDRRINLISRPNTGYVRALIEAIDKSSGPLIARMDADDLASPERFEKQVAFLNAHPDVVVVGSSYELMDEHDRKLHVLHQPTDDPTLQRHCLAGTTPICHPSAMFRRAAYTSVGGYDESFCPAEDLDLWLRLGEIGKLACLDEVLIRYRLHANSVSETRQNKQVDAIRRACQNAANRRGVPNTFKADAGWREQPGAAGRVQQLLKYGWWAFNSGERSTARWYGTRAVRENPACKEAWKLLVVSLIKPLPAAKAGGR
ncbi:MAG TPA: glycosyltransferase [Tepidisphaeraceae bacterium]|jgi:glycosyltransferase involved in cell wall biosynthesis